MVFWVHSQKPDLFIECEVLNKYGELNISAKSNTIEQ